MQAFPQLSQLTREWMLAPRWLWVRSPPPYPPLTTVLVRLLPGMPRVAGTTAMPPSATRSSLLCSAGPLAHRWPRRASALRTIWDRS